MGGVGGLVEVRRLECLASLGECGVLALVGAQQGQVRVCGPGCCRPQRGVVTSSAQRHGGGLTSLAVPET